MTTNKQVDPGTMPSVPPALDLNKDFTGLVRFNPPTDEDMQTLANLRGPETLWYDLPPQKLMTSFNNQSWAANQPQPQRTPRCQLAAPMRQQRRPKCRLSPLRDRCARTPPVAPR